MVNQNGAILTPNFSFGVDSRPTPALSPGIGSWIYYVSGNRVVGYNLATAEMIFFPLMLEVEKIKCLICSPNLKYLACIQEMKGEQKDQVAVLNLQSETIVQTLSLDEPSIAATTIVSIAFSEDSKLLLMQCEEPNWETVCWRWYAKKILCQTQNQDAVLTASFHPHFQQNSLALILSRNGFSLLEVNITTGLISVFMKKEHVKSKFFCWLSGDLVAVVDQDNTIHIFQQDEEKDSIPCDCLQEEEGITSIQEYRNGLLLSGNEGSLVFFYRNDSWYTSLHTCTLHWCTRTNKGHLYCQYRLLKSKDGISSVAVSADQETIVTVLLSGHLAYLNMEELREKEEPKFLEIFPPSNAENPFQLTGGSFASEAVVDLDICAASFCFGVITSEPRLVLWNYSTRQCLVTKKLDHDAFCISLDVSGYHLAIGQQHKLCLFKILRDDILLIKEYPVKKTTVAKFSNSGHLLATVCRLNTIHLYNVHSNAIDPLFVLKGHLSAITDLCWTPNDSEITSVAAGGACYTWVILTGCRDEKKDHVDKNSTFTRVLLGEESKVFASTTDGRIKLLREGKVLGELVTEERSEFPPIGAITEGNIFLYGTSLGEIVSQAFGSSFPSDGGFRSSAEKDVFQLHHGKISAMKVARDASVVLTADDQGVILLSTIQLVVEGVLINTSSKGWTEAESSVLISSKEISLFKSREVELIRMVVSERKNTDYQVMKETHELKDALKSYCSENEKLREDHERQSRKLQELKRDENTKQQIAMSELNARHLSEIEDLKSLQRKRLDVESLKYQKLENDKNDAVFALEEEIFRLQERHKAEVNELKASFEVSLQEEKYKYSLLCGEKKEIETVANQMVADLEIENDVHAEIVQAKQEEANKEAEAEQLRLKVENNLMARGILKLKASKVEDSKQIRKLQKEVQESSLLLEQQAENLDKLQHQVGERDGVISANYQTIQELRREVQALEKHKYVLGHNAEKYKEDLIPKEEHIKELEDQLKSADSRRALSVDAVCNLKTKLKDKERQTTSLQKQVISLSSKQSVQSRRPSSARTAASKISDLRTDEYGVIADLTKKLEVVEERNLKMEKKLESRERANRVKLRQKITENRALLKEISDLKIQNSCLRMQLETVRSEEQSARSRCGRELVDEDNQQIELRGSCSVQRLPVTRPSSMRQYEFGLPHESRPSSSRKSRPQSAIKRRPFSATSLPVPKTPL